MREKMFKGFRSTVFCVSFGLTLLAATQPAQAETALAEDEGTVKLVATLQNSPAFTHVLWKVYRLEGTYQEVRSIPRHTATLNLRPGYYKVVALMKNTERSQSFQLKSQGEQEIVMPMD